MAPRTKKPKKNLQSELKIEKTFQPDVQQASVVDEPTVREGPSRMMPLLFYVAGAADQMLPWGSDVAARDAQLRQFFPTEPLLMSAVYSVAARDSSFAWDIVPTDPTNNPKNTIRAITRVLKNAGNGKGWSRFMMKGGLSLLSQDNGAFWELIRKENRPDSPVIGIRTLDPAHCLRTGNSEVPVIYKDRKGREHELKYYHVVPLEEMPSDIEEMYDVQMSGVTRALRLAQILKSIFIYKDEKVSGRNPRAIDFISGIGQAQVEDAKRIHDEQLNNAGLMRYTGSILVPGIDPTNSISHVRVDLASLPDNFEFDDEMKWYISALAMAFGVDYQEFAPLASGALGSGSQSEILHLKTHGKGPATRMALYEHIINNSGILPSTVEFRYRSHDAQTAEKEAQARYTRGRDRSLRVQSQELDPAAARYMAVQDGDLPEWIATDMDNRGVEAEPGGRQGEMDFSADQITGPQQERLSRRGGMAMLDPYDEALNIDKDEVNRYRRMMAERLGDG